MAKLATTRHDAGMDDAEFDRALIAAAFQMAAEKGWVSVNVAGAARAGGLELVRARERFSGRLAILSRLGRLADQAALAEAPSEGSVRDRLFGLLMRRIDAFQANRAGVLALLRVLPTDPPLALLLTLATRRSMRWMLEAAGVSTRGFRGELRVKGLFAVWVWVIRTWRTDESEDLSATMVALDNALHRAEAAAERLGWRHPVEEPPVQSDEPESAPPEPAA